MKPCTGRHRSADLDLPSLFNIDLASDRKYKVDADSSLESTLVSFSLYLMLVVCTLHHMMMDEIVVRCSISPEATLMVQKHIVVSYVGFTNHTISMIQMNLTCSHSLSCR